MAGIVGRHPDVAVAIDLPAFTELHHHAGGIAQVEHRQAPHLPETIAGMRVVGEFDVHRPALAETILHLPRDLLVGEVRQKRKTSLGDTHDPAPYIATLAVGT